MQTFDYDTDKFTAYRIYPYANETHVLLYHPDDGEDSGVFVGLEELREILETAEGF